MLHISPLVEIDGTIGELTALTDSFAIIRRCAQPHTTGEPCRVTIFAHLLGQCLPVVLKGEIVQRHDDEVEMMFMPPTSNWNHITRVQPISVH